MTDSDPYCKNNFLCHTFFEPQETCLYYTKGLFDSDCHIPCELSNCTKHFISSELCPIFSCIAVIHPAIFTNNWLIIFGIVLGSLCLLGCLVGITVLVVLKVRTRRPYGAIGGAVIFNPEEEEARYLLNDHNASAPILLTSFGGTPTDSSTGSPSAPPSYNAATADPDYVETVQRLEKEYLRLRKNRKPDPLKQETLLRLVLGSARLISPKHELLNSHCLCYECHLRNFEVIIENRNTSSGADSGAAKC